MRIAILLFASLLFSTPALAKSASSTPPHSLHATSTPLHPPVMVKIIRHKLSFMASIGSIFAPLFDFSK